METCVKVNTFLGKTYFRENMSTFLKILGHSRVKKLCAQVPIWL